MISLRSLEVEAQATLTSLIAPTLVSIVAATVSVETPSVETHDSEALDEPYMQISFHRMIRKRAGWLVILFLGEMLTATAMGFFEEEIKRAVVLALFVPLIISSGGNSGSQAATLVIRALALAGLGRRAQRERSALLET